MARIEVSDEIVKKLDNIKKSNWQIQGKGHTETITFLINEYKTKGTIELCLNRKLEEIDLHIQQATCQSIRAFFKGMFAFINEEP